MSDHMKRLAAPRTWPLKRKASIYATKPSPGAHSIESSLPSVTVLRDLVNVCDTAREAKRIVGNRELLVDGKPIKNPKASIGFMDTISIPKMNLNYRMLLSDKGKLAIVPIGEDEAKWKLCKIEGKTKITGGKIQLNLSGGRNVIMDANKYKTGDTLKIAVDSQEILGEYLLGEGAVVMVVDGVHAGKIETIDNYTIVKGPSQNTVKFKSEAETVIRNIFVIGSSKSEITLPEGSE